jgi:hypothetical protein
VGIVGALSAGDWVGIVVLGLFALTAVRIVVRNVEVFGRRNAEPVPGGSDGRQISCPGVFATIRRVLHRKR